MIKYPHPLDYVTGLKYALTDKKLDVAFEVSPNNFYVEELVDFDKLGFDVKKGNYVVLRVTRKNIDTLKVARLFEKNLGIPLSNIYLFGLKDKNASAVSYFFVKSSIINESVFPIIAENFAVEVIGYVRSKPQRKHHIGNRFKVCIEGVTKSDIYVLKEIVNLILEVGLPSYYGYQRFGYKRYNTHVLGKYLITGREDLFANQLLTSLYPLENDDVLVKRTRLDFSTLWYEQLYVRSALHSGLKTVQKYARNIFINAYASYLFNLLLNKLIDESGIGTLRNKRLPLPGCIESFTYYESIVKKEGLSSEMLKYMPCFSRSSLFRPLNNDIKILGNKVVYEFTLEPGMYATVVLRELFKENLFLTR